MYLILSGDYGLTIIGYVQTETEAISVCANHNHYDDYEKWYFDKIDEISYIPDNLVCGYPFSVQVDLYTNEIWEVHQISSYVDICRKTEARYNKATNFLTINVFALSKEKAREIVELELPYLIEKVHRGVIGG